MNAAFCQWCEKPMVSSRQPKRFCSAAHRAAFHEACRHLGERMFAEGALSIADLRREASDA